MLNQKIAIVGAGVSGLFTAYEIAKANSSCKDPKNITIDIFEKNNKQGGNAQTVVFSLGKSVGLPNINKSKDYIRWADLGVNDINLAAYTNVKKLMEDIEFHNEDWKGEKEKEKRLLPLENTETYFSLDGDITITDDKELKQGVTDPKHSLSHIEEGFLPKWIDILYAAAFDEIKDEEKSLNTTCADFFNGCIDHPKERLKIFAEKQPWYPEEEAKWQWENDQWIKEAQRRLTLLCDDIFYARISAMYFANETGPENMLLATPFKYYKIQESADGETPKRRYFKYGAQTWLEFLAKHLEEKITSDSHHCEIKIHYEFETELSLYDDKITIKKKQDCDIFNNYDRAIITTHANHALDLLNFKNNDKEQEAAIAEMLGSISYATSVAVCHTWSGVLPPNRNLWRAYNVIIRKGAALKPYSMTYVCNRHQNDAGNDQYNLFGSPQFFVTLNPQIPIPDNAILRKLSEDQIPEELHRHLPQETMSEARALQFKKDKKLDSVATNADVDDRAITYFYHNMIDRNCFVAQKNLVEYHNTQPLLYFAGAWTYGSGLHEECWLQSHDVAQRIINT
jgi:predicted NAD/FAD-binding protein